MRNISYSQANIRWSSTGPAVFCLSCLVVGGLSAVRLLYEGMFPEALWLGSRMTAVGVGVVLLLVGALAGRRLFNSPAAGTLTPLLMNLIYLFSREVDLSAGRFLFLASLWLTVLFLAHFQGLLKRHRFLGFGFVAAFLLPVYFLTLGQTVGTADTFEFQVVIPKLGIVHPTGYPLYLLLTKLFTFIPVGTVAWRINVGTAVYAIGAACLLFYFLKSLTGQRLVPVLAAVLFGLSPTFWSQSIQAEVYSLHALVVAGVLVLVQRLNRWQLNKENKELGQSSQMQGIKKAGVLLPFLLGLGLTNHLTTIILLPAVFLSGVFNVGLKGISSLRFRMREGLIVLGAFIVPLLLYLYLPLRWQAVNGQAMGLERFVDWVVGGRFQGALNLTAVLSDPARVGVVGRLLAAEWGWLHLFIGLIGLIVLAQKEWRAALFLGLVWLGFVYYALSYYVPDLSVFLIPAHLVIAVFWGVGVWAGLRSLAANRRLGSLLVYPLLTLLMLFVFQQAIRTWEQVDASKRDGETAWGRAVLALPLDPESAILADSLKFPPLYYLQQAEGLRSEMEIMVLPDETAYRAELDRRLATGQTVYLARFLPGLAGVYHIRSVGPLTEVSIEPLTMIPNSARAGVGNVAFGDIELVGYELETESPYEAEETAVTFYWQAGETIEAVWQVYVRWAGGDYEGPVLSQFAANNNYPTNAWRATEIVADFHSLPRPAVNETTELTLQVALAPPFTPADELDWQTVTTALLDPFADLADSETVHAQVGPLLIDGVSFAEQIRPGSDLVVGLHGYGLTPDSLALALVAADSYQPLFPENTSQETIESKKEFSWTRQIETGVEPGNYLLIAGYPGAAAVCSWLGKDKSGCVLGEIEVSGVPLPDDAVNFEDKIALLEVEVPDETLQPGGKLAVNLSWLGLVDIMEDYTVFVQVVNEQGQIVGQADSWPLQGTFPTSQWTVGERVSDPYLIELADQLPPGQYQLHVGWYLLGTARRLVIVDKFGTAVDDKVVVPLNQE